MDNTQPRDSKLQKVESLISTLSAQAHRSPTGEEEKRASPGFDSEAEDVLMHDIVANAVLQQEELGGRKSSQHKLINVQELDVENFSASDQHSLFTDSQASSQAEGRRGSRVGGRMNIPVADYLKGRTRLSK